VFSNILLIVFMMKCCDKMSNTLNPQCFYIVIIYLDACSLPGKNGFFLITR